MGDRFSQLEQKAKRIGNLDHVGGILSWDQEVVMPPEGIQARSQQQSVVSGLHHRLLTEDELGDVLAEIDRKGLSEEQQAVVREIERQHKRARKVPMELQEEIAEKSSTSVEVWKEARKEDDFEKFAPHLEELIELKQEYAEHIDPGKEPYQVLFEDFEPYISFERVEEILQQLEEELPDLISRIASSDKDITTDAFKGDFPEEKQKEVMEGLVEDLGFEFERGRFDTSTHPFTNGNQFDTRITARFDEENLKEGLFATIHECGHALYQLGLPDEHYGLPLGASRELSVHESQSRLWENHVGRSEEFWEYYLPRLKERFPEQFDGVTVQDCFESANQIYDDNLIRIEADELTYHLHIVLRFELGRKLINGELGVEELPQAWNDRMEEYLGVRPETDAEGCLQDIHWGWGQFGYFSTYTLGSMIAAQLFDAAQEDLPDLEEDIRNGDFEALLSWLREEIHLHGQLYTTEELVERAAGEKPAAEPFLDYAEEKYSRIYDL